MPKRFDHKTVWIRLGNLPSTLVQFEDQGYELISMIELSGGGTVGSRELQLVFKRPVT